MSVIAIIPARGGSKRIPGKNIREFCGKPVIAYAIEAALESKLFDEVMVSTDSEEIAEIAQKYGANVPFYRSAEAANDMATTRMALLEVLGEYKKRGQEFDVMCCIYPASVFTDAEKLQQGYEKLIETGVCGVVTMAPYSVSPYWAHRCKNGLVSALYPDAISMRSQDMETMYFDAGQFYFYDVKGYLAGEETSSTAMIELSNMECQDIDTPEDMEIAKMKYRLLQEKKANK